MKVKPGWYVVKKILLQVDHVALDPEKGAYVVGRLFKPFSSDNNTTYKDGSPISFWIPDPDDLSTATVFGGRFTPREELL